jgi:hypothetical protein
MINLSYAHFIFMSPGVEINYYELSEIAGKDARKNWNSLIF